MIERYFMITIQNDWAEIAWAVYWQWLLSVELDPQAYEYIKLAAVEIES